jgi:tetratricopeptide (TPR) repeat protein
MLSSGARLVNIWFFPSLVLFAGTILQDAHTKRIEFPPPPREPKPVAISERDVVGAEACSQCHRQQYEAWSRSTHAQAGGKPERTTLLAPFDGTPIRFNDAEVIPSVTSRGVYQFVVRQNGRAEQRFPVEGVVGKGHLAGGGTQAFLTRYPDGTLRVLPFEYSASNRTWFTNTNARTKKGWVPITEGIALAECTDWPPARVFGTENRFSNCQECHGSQIQLTFNEKTKKYDTRYTTLTINCESCHGPGRKHIDLARSGAIEQAADIGIRSLSTLSKDESLEVCFQCHALKDVIRPGYFPGKPLQDYYALKFPILGDKPYLPDGRVRTFAYQETHLFSDCYLNGSMTCTSCHDPHSQGYWDINKKPLKGRYDDGQCTGCHASKAANLSKHTFHQPESVGSRCVSCHMPYLQHPEVGKKLRFARSDHTISIPRPLFDASWDLEGACQQCHRNYSVQQLEAKVREWYGEIKPHPSVVEGLVRAQTVTARSEAARLLLRADVNHPMAQFMGVALMWEKFFHPDMASLEQEVLESLKALSQSRDIDLQALALAALHLVAGEEQTVRSYLAERLKTADRRIRDRWALALGFFADTYRLGGEQGKAITTYRKALEIQPSDARIYHNLAQSYADQGDFRQAIQNYRRSLELDPTQPLAYVNLGIAYAAQGDYRNAISQYEAAIARNPNEPLAYFNLANVYLEQQQPRRAIEFYQKAVALDPSLSLGHYYLARAYVAVRDFSKALDAVKRSLEFDPSRESARQLRRDLERVVR